jgi:hypothetical protein
VRGCLLLVIGFIAGAGLMLVWWPKQPTVRAVPAATDLHLTLSDAFLARELQHRFTTISVPSVTNVGVRSVPPSALAIRADAGAGPVSVPIAVEVQPVADAGQIRISIISSQLGGVPIPSQLTGFLTDIINSRTHNLLGRDTHVTGIRTLPGALEILADYAGP